MQTKILIIALIEHNGKILLRKKPDGAPPYKETWYLFGVEINNGDQNFEELLNKQIHEQTGINISIIERLSWDTEIKNDHDGEEKLFVYLDCKCIYLNGELTPGKGIEKLEWVSKENLSSYDLVPPSKKLFSKLGYLHT